MRTSRQKAKGSRRKAEGSRQCAAANTRKEALGLLRSAEGQLLDAEGDLSLSGVLARDGFFGTAEHRMTFALRSLAAAERYIRMARGKA
jgi:hypothetical protein